MPLDAVSPHRRSSSSSQKDIHGDEREAKETTNRASVDLVLETESKRTSRSEQETETRLGSHLRRRSQIVPRSDKRKTRKASAQICRRERMESEGHDIPMEVFSEGLTKDDTGGVRRGRGGEKPKAGLIRPGFTWEIGARLEAKDFMDKWYSAKIVGIGESDDSVRIHFDGWNQRYDEWVKMDSDRLRPLTRHSDRRKSQESKMLYKIGESVYARWTDCRMYAARIVSVNPNGTYEVMFDDGVKKTIKAINVDVRPPLSSIGCGRRPSESSGKRHSLLASEGDTNATGVKQRCDDVHGRIGSRDDNDDNNGDDEDMPIEMSPVEKPIVTIKQAEDLINSSAAAKRRLIHVKNVHGKSKKPLQSSSVGSGGDDETEHRCPHADCNKHFRNSTLVQYHIKYYHPDDKMPDAAKEENLGLSGRKMCISASSEPAGDLAEKRMKARWSKSLVEYQSSVVDTGDDAGDLMSADPRASAVPMAIESSLQPQSRFLSKAAAFESRDRFQTMNRRRAKSLRKRRKQRMKFRSDVCSLSKKVINCVCRRSTESTQLIQCSLCLCWQHLHCLQVDEAEISQLPSSSYICQPCTSPARLRENAKYSFCQDWLKEGRLPEFSEALTGSTVATHGSAGKAKIMKLTHQLVADLHDVRRVIDSVNRCIFVAQDKNEGKLSHQQTENKDNGRMMENTMNKITSEQNGKSYVAETSEIVKKIEMMAVRSHQAVPEIAEKSNAASLADQSSNMQLRVSIDELSADSIDMSTVAKNGEKQSNSRVNAKEAEENFASVGINSLQSAAKALVKKESCERDEGRSRCVNGEHLGDLSEEKPRENDCLRNGGLRATTDRGPEMDAADTDGKVTMSAPEREDKVENGKLKKENEVDEDHLFAAEMSSAEAAQASVDDQRNQLLLYISQMQDNIEDSLEIIEEQVTALESGEGSRNSSENILKDLPRVKKTLNQLITDLNKVCLISSFNS